VLHVLLLLLLLLPAEPAMTSLPLQSSAASSVSLTSSTTHTACKRAASQQPSQQLAGAAELTLSYKAPTRTSWFLSAAQS
jgi:hypothetical protein